MLLTDTVTFETFTVLTTFHTAVKNPTAKCLYTSGAKTTAEATTRATATTTKRFSALGT